MSRLAGERISGMVGSADTGTNGLALTIAVTSAIRVVLGSQVGQHGVKYSSRDAYHPLPGSPSVGCVRGVKNPLSSTRSEEGLYGVVVHFLHGHFELVVGSHKVGSTVGTELDDGST